MGHLKKANRLQEKTKKNKNQKKKNTLLQQLIKGCFRGEGCGETILPLRVEFMRGGGMNERGGRKKEYIGVVL